MKLIIAFSIVLLAVAEAIPLMAPTANQCHPFVPSHANPAFSYVECDLTCSLVGQKDVLCAFEIGQVNDKFEYFQLLIFVSLAWC